jgi:uncharacterized surface protein with fasciclin (FAS1) repeats/plastocyanin
MKSILRLGALAALLFVSAAVPAAAQTNPCGTDGPVIAASSYEYLPNYLEVEAGTTVAWVNFSGFHDVNGDVSTLSGESFNNPVPFSLSAVGGTMAGTCMGTVTFDEPGTYSYDCSISNHALLGMVGTIVVSGGQQPATVVEVIVNSPDHTTLETAVIAAGLADDLSGEGPFTVFAPTDAAFAALPAGTIEAVLADEQLLNAILTYHVAGGAVLSTDLTDGMEITTLNGEPVYVMIGGGLVMINDAVVTVADIVTGNGVVHVINAVLLPPSPQTNTVVDIIVNSTDHTTLEAAVIAAGLADDLSGQGPFTVFAPTDAAFSALPAGTIEAVLADAELLNAILTYHVAAGEVLSTALTDGMEITTLNGASVTVSIMGGTVMINNATVTVADLVADNGVVHVIDAVLLPPAPPTTTVVDIIVNSPDHTTLETAVIAAGLADDLSGDGPFTVFAPTDAAFAALPAGTIEAVLADPILLNAILTYHVAAGNVLSTDLTDGMEIATLNGASVTVSIMGGTVMINDATVTVADLVADNGVVHVIDAVLLPPTGVQEASTIAVDVFPNPASDVINLRAELMSNDRVVATDAQGRITFDGVATPSVDVSAWAAGLYTLSVVRDGVPVFTTRVAISH